MLMWLVRFRMRAPRPLARAIQRFMCGPSSTQMVLILSSSTSAPLLCSALAMADSSTLRSSLAPRLGLNSSTFSASPTLLPRIWSATRRTFCVAMRAYLCLAATCIWIPLCLHFGFGGLALAVALEDAGRRELAQLVADHVLAHQHRYVLTAVVHRDGETHHLGRDHGTA